MKTFAISSLLLLHAGLVGMTHAAQPTYIPTQEILQAREEFRDKGFGIFIHWGIYSMLGSGEWVLNDPNIYHNAVSYTHLTLPTT